NNTELTHLNCIDNELAALDLSNNTKLQYLYCYNNKLTSLEPGMLTELLELWCGGNQLTDLDLSNNILLGSLEWNCESNDFRVCEGACIEIDIREMPNLQEVCVWENPFPPEGICVNTTDSPNVSFTQSCTPS
ncbi:MAG: leucine-rich repeat domain-containing protein, partial [Bacteroidota bacterium]|nr:leucine-rich repeat domain-containing protein [Bacteroidota bacterium]